MKQVSLLIVEDDAPVRDLAKCVFLSKGKDLDLKIYDASDGLEAVDILKQTHIDVVLTDYCMPQMDGSKLCDYINENYPYVKKILMSGYTDRNIPMDKADRFIKKPFNITELFNLFLSLI